ncbi:hypothetical protein [Streptomyces sp. NPDC050560]|uniref:hypothetical protein n=1 Tax=Streptomyces sp. NPDC050560 TaxID=3365630 RepID=UPI0037B47C65
MAARETPRPSQRPRPVPRDMQDQQYTGGEDRLDLDALKRRVSEKTSDGSGRVRTKAEGTKTEGTKAEKTGDTRDGGGDRDGPDAEEGPGGQEPRGTEDDAYREPPD